MRLGGRRWGRGVWRGLVRRTVLVVVVVLGLSVAAPQQSLTRPGVDPLPLSWLWSWFDLPAGWTSPPSPVTPVQGSAGSAAGKSHTASTASTRSSGGTGHAPGKGNGELDPYTPYSSPAPAVAKTDRKPDMNSFDPARSVRIAKDSSATSDVFQNPDGSFTRKVYAGVHNFKATNGAWAPIDTS